MHISTELSDSFQTMDGPKGWDKEKSSIPLEAHYKSPVEQSFSKFQAKTLKSCIFIFWLILLKLHISASEIESFPMTYRLSNSGEEKW